MDNRVLQLWGVQESLHSKLEAYCQDLDEKYGADFYDDAFLDFIPTAGEDISELYDVEEFEEGFHAWFFYNWLPGEYEFDDKNLVLQNQPFAKTFLADAKDLLSQQEKAFIEANLGVPFRFYQIQAIQAAKHGLVLKDLDTDQVVTVFEEHIDENFAIDDVIVVRVVTVDGLSFICGAMDLILPETSAEEIKEFFSENASEMDEDLIRQYYFELRNEFTELEEEEFDEEDEDDDDFMFITLFYQLKCTPTQAFEKLYTLCDSDARETLLEDAIKNDLGEITQVSIPWLDEEVDFEDQESVDASMLGMITIDGSAMQIEVNMRESAEIIKSIIEERFADLAVLENESCETLEEVLSSEEDEPACCDH